MAALTFKSDALRTQLDTPYFGCLAPAAFARTRGSAVKAAPDARQAPAVRRPGGFDRGSPRRRAAGPGGRRIAS